MELCIGTALRSEMLGIEFVHECFTQIKDGLTTLDRLVQHNPFLLLFHSGSVSIKDIVTVRLVNQLVPLCGFIHQLDIPSFTNVIHCFSK